MNRKPTVLFVISMVGLASVAASARASVFTWNDAGGGNWTDHTNWNGPVGAFPNGADDAARRRSSFRNLDRLIKRFAL
ncbi:MAG: hypothetical protein IID36_02615 [Planctomycetes bacterium]|nr:hypothetical protein [Planctomycetota bacterium]